MGAALNMKDGLFRDIDNIINGESISTFTSVVNTGLVTLERPPNEVVFIESPKFLNGPKELWPEQYRFTRDFYELSCPVCNDLDKMYRGGEIKREDDVLFEYNVCPKCGARKEDVVEALNFYYSINGVVGMRSGKSTGMGCFLAAFTADILCVPDLHKKLGIVESDALDGTFVAAAQKQASDTIWSKFKGMYDNSPWFQYYKHALLDIEVNDKRFRRGELYWETDNLIHWQDKHIRLTAVPTNSATQAGRTRIFAVIDELARLDSGESKRSASEVYRVLENSLYTVRQAVSELRAKGNIEIPDAVMASISSPLFQTDKSMSLLDDAKIDKRIYAFKKATWEFNPHSKKEDFASLYARDPIGTERDFGANPPGAENPFIKDPNIIKACTDYKRTSCFTLRENYFDLKAGTEGNEATFHFVKMDILNMSYMNLAEYVIHCDPGETGDSFSLTLAHKQDGVCCIDGYIEIRPVPEGSQFSKVPRSVHFPSVVNLILALHKKIKIRLVTYDKWNSTEQIHRLIDAGIIAIGKNLTRDDHLNFLEGLNSGWVSMPAPEVEVADPSNMRNVPCAQALYELSKLNDNGAKVDHPPYGHNDIIQGGVGVYRSLMHPDLIPIEKKKTKQTWQNRQKVPPVTLTRLRR
ncbi:MAG: hypothetical protein WC444_04550 [Candidatus Paceibacterota bacterium]